MERLLLKAALLWLRTLRAEVLGEERREGLLEPGRPAVVALWHKNLVYTLYHFRHFPGVVMTSRSKDGEWVARAAASWGQRVVRGSRMKGGLEAVARMARLISEDGLSAGIVVDGSKGPACRAQAGALILSRRTGRPILPTGFAARPARRLHTWDRLILPLPFARCCIVYGEPFTVPPSAKGPGLEPWRSKLERALNRADEEAERALGAR